MDLNIWRFLVFRTTETLNAPLWVEKHGINWTAMLCQLYAF